MDERKTDRNKLGLGATSRQFECFKIKNVKIFGLPGQSTE